MKRIVIDVYDEGAKNGLINIESYIHHFLYSYDKMGGDMQCNFEGETDECNNLLSYLHIVEQAVRAIDEHNLALNRTLDQQARGNVCETYIGDFEIYEDR